MLLDTLAELNTFPHLYESTMWFSLAIDTIRDSEFPITLYLCSIDPDNGPNVILQEEYRKFSSQIQAMSAINELIARWKCAYRDEDQWAT